MKQSSPSLAQNQTKNKKDGVQTKSNEKNDAKKKTTTPLYELKSTMKQNKRI